MPDCIFCRIAAGEIPTELVHDSERVVAFRDVNPQAPTHVLIIPRRHVSHATELGVQDAQLLGDMFAAANALAESEGLSKGFRLVINNGPAAGQSVFHLHMHLLGGRQLRWPPG